MIIYHKLTLHIIHGIDSTNRKVLNFTIRVHFPPIKIFLLSYTTRRHAESDNFTQKKKVIIFDKNMGKANCS